MTAIESTRLRRLRRAEAARAPIALAAPPPSGPCPATRPASRSPTSPSSTPTRARSRPSPRVRAALARDRRRFAAPLPRPGQPAACARPRPPATASAPEQVLAGNGSDDCLTILYRAFLDAGRSGRLPLADLRPLRRWPRCRARSSSRLPFASERARAWSCPPSWRDSGAKMIILANPNNPSATLVPVDDAARALRRGAGRDRRRRRGLRRLRARRRARRQHAAVPGPAREPGRAAHVLQELQPGGRAPRPAVRRRADRRRADQGQGQLQRQRASPRRWASRRWRIAPTTTTVVRRTLDERARLEAALGGAGPDLARIGRQLPARRDRRRAPRRSTWRSSKRASWSAGGPRPSCAPSSGSPSASPPTTIG